MIRSLAIWISFFAISLSSAIAQDTTATTDGVAATNIFLNLFNSLAGVTNFLTGFMYVLGIGLTVSAMMKFKKFGHRTAFMNVETGIVAPLIQFVVGVALLYTPSLLEILNYTLFRDPNIINVMNYAQTNNPDFANVLGPVLGVVQVLGLIAFIRGMLILSKGVQKEGGNQPGQVTKGIVHIISGVLGINVIQTINVVQATFGLS